MLKNHQRFGHSTPIDSSLYREAFGPGYQMHAAVANALESPLFRHDNPDHTIEGAH